MRKFDFALFTYGEPVKPVILNVFDPPRVRHRTFRGRWTDKFSADEELKSPVVTADYGKPLYRINVIPK